MPAYYRITLDHHIVADPDTPVSVAEPTTFASTVLHIPLQGDDPEDERCIFHTVHRLLKGHPARNLPRRVPPAMDRAAVSLATTFSRQLLYRGAVYRPLADFGEGCTHLYLTGMVVHQ